MNLFVREDENNRLILKLPKLIDLKNGIEVKDSINRELDKNDCESYVLDLSDLEFIDSLGLGILVGIQRRTYGYSKKLFFLNPRPSIKKVFEVTQLQRVFNIIEE
ncbi:MAG TPA: STAS domain-containing protein [Thermotogota bacterium]|nr:STAS domain-containing protein [Thermotogota bacterium]HPJ88535.1 STAS domain-containing protein [Thermotogota bacterium]HPR96469.1 STAS domain-containing protein [Thermotogota bacterium]